MRFRKTIQEVRESRTLLVVVVTVAMVLDNSLLTAVVPLLPVVLLKKCPKDNSTETSDHITNLTAVGSHGTLGSFQKPHDVLSDCEKAVNTNLGLLLASQFVVRLVVSPFGGCICKKLGYFVVLMIGSWLMLTSSLVYAFSDSYVAYLVGRVVHGLAAILTEIGGLGVVGYQFRDDDEQRGAVLGIVIGGFAVGSLVGPIIGGILGDRLGPMGPFVILAGLLALLAVVEILIFQRETDTEESEHPMALWYLLKDPRALIAAGALTMPSIIFGLLEPSLPVWMIQSMEARTWQLGAVLIPSGSCYILACIVMGSFSYRIGRWVCLAVPIFVTSVCIAMLPFATSFLKLMAPMAVLGFCFGAVDCNCCAVLFYIVGRDHKGAYGASSSLVTFAFSLGFILGPALSSIFFNIMGFEWMLRSLGLCTVWFAPLCFYLRGSDSEPPSEAENEKTVLILPAIKPETVEQRLT